MNKQDGRALSVSDMPIIEEVQVENPTRQSLFVISEGFEPRSLAYAQKILDTCQYSKIVLCKNYPEKENSKIHELQKMLQQVSDDIAVIQYNRYEPAAFEEELFAIFEAVDAYNEIHMDISVMSKLMIMQILFSLREFAGRLKIVYTEPEDYKPLQKDFYNRDREITDESIIFPTYGVHDVTRTPLLSSIIMHGNPTVLVAFLSFNEQLIRALLSEMNPAALLLINGVPPLLAWRENAMLELHERVLKEYPETNEIRDSELVRRCSTLYYQETLTILSDIYQKYSISNRIVLAPTGSKMQAVGCALFKICCPDVHVEYPTPESYYTENFTGASVRCIHQVVFTNYKNDVAKIKDAIGLNM